MIKSKLYILIAFSLLIIIFSIAAVCNQCTALKTQTTSSEEITTTEESTREIGGEGGKEDQLTTHEIEEETTSNEYQTTESQATTSQTSQSSSGENHSPVINSISVSEGTIFTNSTVDAWVDAQDPDGDTLSYNWSIADSDASINNVNSAHTEWRAPSNPTTVKIIVGVSDGKGGFIESATLVEVVSPSSGGQEEQPEETTSQQEGEGIIGTTITARYDSSRSGVLALGENVNDIVNLTDTPFLAGDYSLYQQAKSYISFDISNLLNYRNRPNFTITSVKIEIRGLSITEGDQGSLSNDSIVIKQHNFGNVDNSDYYNTGGTLITEIRLSHIAGWNLLSLDNNGCPNLLPNFLNAINNLSDSNRWYQIKIGLNSTTPFTGVRRSLVAFPRPNITLRYKYTYTE